MLLYVRDEEEEEGSAITAPDGTAPDPADGKDKPPEKPADGATVPDEETKEVGGCGTRCPSIKIKIKTVNIQ